MKRITKIGLWLLGLTFTGLLFVQSASADTTEALDIHVSIAANKSVAAGTTYYYFGGIPLETSSASITALVITNDSGSYVETYTMQGANAISDLGGTNWTLAAATGTNTYALAAQFSTARRENDQVDWDSTDYLTTSPQACSATQFGNGTAGESGTGVSPVAGSRDRNLWFKIHTPDVSTGTEGRTAQVTIAVQ